jgi:hypothetical protein
MYMYMLGDTYEAFFYAPLPPVSQLIPLHAGFMIWFPFVENGETGTGKAHSTIVFSSELLLWTTIPKPRVHSFLN